MGGAAFGLAMHHEMRRALDVILARGETSSTVERIQGRMRTKYAHASLDPVSSPARMSFDDARTLAREAPYGALAEATTIWVEEFQAHFGRYPTNFRPRGENAVGLPMNAAGAEFYRDSHTDAPPAIQDLMDVWPDIKKWTQVAGIMAGGALALMALNFVLPRS